MAETLQQIKSWASANLKYWEQAALEKIVTIGDLSEKDILELVSYLLQDAGLESVPVDRPVLSYPKSGVTQSVPSPCTLQRIFNLRNVNALPNGQEITFGPQLTLVYGNNGVGKSGYARALAAVGFARGERDVLPNMDLPAARAIPQADVEITVNGIARIVTWTKGTANGDVPGLYVFEGNSLTAHLNQPNSINFSPFGLPYLTRLAEETDEVRSRVRRLINEREQPHALQPLFEGQSEVAALILGLNADTDLRRLEALAVMTDEDRTSIEDLERRVAELKLQDVPQQIQKRRQEISDLQNIKNSIENARTDLGDAGAGTAFRLIEEFLARREALAASGADQFRFNRFTQIGTTEWRAFMASAKTLADAEAKRGEEYPTSSDHCLFCRQPLSEEAVAVILKVWAFLKSDSQARFDQARAHCEAKVRELMRINVGYFSKDSNIRRLLQSDAPLLISALDAQMQAFATRKQELIDSLSVSEKRELAPQIDVDLTDLQRLIAIRESDIALLNGSNSGQQLREAEGTLRLLRHRQTLREQMSRVREYVERRKWATRAERSLGSTRSITTKYNELFKELVTERYISNFTTLLHRFGPDIKATIEARGFKGETVRQIILRKPATAQGFTVERVLSDGEKKAVALADFLTEVALDETSGPIVFDDPVTSLDNGWKKVFATCLAEQAMNRQVIVFTHDLSFLYHLKNEAELKSLGVTSHWIRTENGNPGFVYVNNSPVCEKEYSSAQIARNYYSLAKNLPPQQQQSVLQQGFGALRTSYEALIIFELFKGVVLRFEERISFGRLKEIRIDSSILEELVKHMEDLSRHIDAHLHSDAMTPTKPTLADLLGEIDAFEAIRKKQRALP